MPGFVGSVDWRNGRAGEGLRQAVFGMAEHVDNLNLQRTHCPVDGTAGRMPVRTSRLFRARQRRREVGEMGKEWLGTAAGKQVGGFGRQ